MLKKLFSAAVAFPFFFLPAYAQTHYQGGPKSSVPPHIGELPRSKSSAPTDQSGQHHYQGGPRAPHHIGNMPGVQQKPPEHSKKQKRRGHQR